MQQTIAHLKDEANSALDAKDYHRALGYLRALEILQPGQSLHNRVLTNIACCHYYLENYDEALETYQRVARFRPADKQLANNLALAAAKLGKIAIYNEKLLSADTWTTLANESAFRGRKKTALRFFDVAIRKDPQRIETLYYRCSLAKKDEAADWIKKTLAMEPVGPEENMFYHYMLGDLHDKCGDYENAIKHYKQANDQRHEIKAQEFSIEKYKSRHRKIIRFFSKKRLEELKMKLARLPLSHKKIIFIIAMPRSGTTLTSRILLSDSRTADLGESSYLVKSIMQLENERGLEFHKLIPVLTDEDWLRLQQLFLERIHKPGEVLIDKSLDNHPYAGIIPFLFPGSKIIDCRRNREDTLISCYKSLFPGSAYWTSNIESLKSVYATHREYMDKWSSMLPEKSFYTLEYRQLVENKSEQIARLADFCGLHLSENPEAVRDKGYVTTASYLQVREPINKKGLNTFARYKDYISFD